MSVVAAGLVFGRRAGYALLIATSALLIGLGTLVPGRVAAARAELDSPLRRELGAITGMPSL